MLAVLLFFSAQLPAKKMKADELREMIELIASRELAFEQAQAIENAIRESTKASALSTPIKRKHHDTDDEDEPLPLAPKFRVNRDLGNGSKLLCSPAGQKGDKFLPEAHDHHVIYAHMLTKDKNPLIPRNDRLNFPTLLGRTKITEKNLNHALLTIENKIREWIHYDRKIYYHTTYIGLAENLAHRAYGHSSSFSSVSKKFTTKGFDLPDVEEEREGEDGFTYDDKGVIPLGVGKKVRFTMMAKDLFKAHVRMSPLIYDIPQQWMPLVEVLVGHLFNSTYKAGTVLGNEEAIERFDEYIKSEVRLGKYDPKKKIGVRFPGEIEEMHRRTVRHLLGIDL